MLIPHCDCHSHKKEEKYWPVGSVLERDHGKEAWHSMEVVHGRSVINQNIKCVILKYMSDNWVLNYPSIKSRIYSARSLVMKIIVRRSSVGLTHNLKIHARTYREHPELRFSPPEVSVKLVYQVRRAQN